MSAYSPRLTRRTVLNTAAAATLASPALAQAPAWPARAVTLVVPYAPGASNDTFTRAIAEILQKKFGQPFLVDNRPGAGGFTGTNSVARAQADGYTLLESPSSIAGYKPIMKVPMDPLKDLTPLSMIARSPAAMVVPSSLPVKTVKEFVEYAKANTDKVFYGFAGIGTTQHQQGELFKKQTGLKIKGVNYKSSADAQTDLVAGRLGMMIVSVSSTLGQITSGQLRLLAYADSNYPPGSPEAPTFAQAGVPGMESAQLWWCFFAPPGLPRPLAERINAVLNEAILEPSFVALLQRGGATPAPVSIEEFTKVLKTEIAMVEEFAKEIGPIN